MCMTSHSDSVSDHTEVAEELEGLKGLMRAGARSQNLPDHAEALVLTVRETRGVARILERNIARLDQLRSI